ncbi:hypothetical protein [Saccharopolyspora shandongensis]|uniref:hypothetical protein n=1 Tax=Saccharopolyspora shandongensis TaxID=418495 RepID=UPI0033FFBFD4
MNQPVPWQPPAFNPPPLPPFQPTVRTCNHLLHFLIGLMTCGLWWLLWPFIALQVYLDNRDAERWYVEALHRYQFNLWQWHQANGRSGP